MSCPPPQKGGRKTNPEGSLIPAEYRTKPAGLESINQPKKNIANPTHPNHKGLKQPGPTTKLGIDFWHAVEFSSVGHAPPHDFRHAPGQPFKPTSPHPTDPNRIPSRDERDLHLLEPCWGDLDKLAHPAFPLQIARFTTAVRRSGGGRRLVGNLTTVTAEGRRLQIDEAPAEVPGRRRGSRSRRPGAMAPGAMMVRAHGASRVDAPSAAGRRGSSARRVEPSPRVATSAGAPSMDLRTVAPP